MKIQNLLNNQIMYFAAQSYETEITKQQIIENTNVQAFYHDFYHDNENLLQLIQELQQEECKNRAVTCLSMSKNMDNFFLTCYWEPELETLSSPQGLMILWSLHQTIRPEYKLHCHAPITSAIQSPFSKNIFIGGLYSGQLVLWDIRSSRLPVQKTNFESKGHNFPVYSTDFYGTKNSNGLISSSNDGRICLWSLDMFSYPKETFDLSLENEQINISSMVNRNGDMDGFLVGTESGKIYKLLLHANEKKDKIKNTYNLHSAPISGLSLNQTFSESKKSTEGLLLSSSLDWSIGLWNPSNQLEPLTQLNFSENYIFDVKWHPTDPAIFASVDGDGFIDIWGLNNFEEPKIHYQSKDKEAINKLEWTTEGSKIITGDAFGKLSLYNVNQEVFNLYQAIFMSEDMLEQVENNLIKSNKNIDDIMDKYDNF